LSVSIEDLKHPKYSCCIDYFLLIFSRVFDIEVDHVEQQIQDPNIATIQQGLEHKHEELLIEAVQDDFSLITFNFAQVNAKLFLI
jgi:hypothetical protein